MTMSQCQNVVQNTNLNVTDRCHDIDIESLTMYPLATNGLARYARTRDTAHACAGASRPHRLINCCDNCECKYSISLSLSRREASKFFVLRLIASIGLNPVVPIANAMSIGVVKSPPA